MTIQTPSGFTLFSKTYNEAYHSSEGALEETFVKHVIPAFAHIKKPHIRILDLCFGLGFNVLASFIYAKKHQKTIELVSLEKDEPLLENLQSFPYPDEFKPFLPIIHCLKDGFFQNDYGVFKLILGDATKTIDDIEQSFDVIYLDPFSYKTNQEMWSVQFLQKLYVRLAQDGILTTYSRGQDVLKSIHQAGFITKINKTSLRSSTLAFKDKACLQD